MPEDMDTQAPVADTLAPESTESTETAETGNWYDGLPSELKDNVNITKYKSLEELGKGHLNAVSKIGEASAYTAPDKPEAYKLDPVVNLHAEAKVTPEFETGFRKMMHEIGVPNKQANSIYQNYLNQVSNGLTQRDEAIKVNMEKAQTELTQEWGQKYDEKITMAKRVIEKFGGKSAIEEFNNQGFGRNPKMIKLMAKIGEKFSEDSFQGVGGIDLTANASTANAKIKSIKADKAHPYWNDGPGHEDAVKEVTRLYQIAGEEDV